MQNDGIGETDFEGGDGASTKDGQAADGYYPNAFTAVVDFPFETSAVRWKQ